MKTALITGASGGIGRALTLMAAGMGYRLLLTGRNVRELEKTAGEARKLLPAGEEAVSPSGPEGEVFCLREDLSDPEAPDRILETVRTRFGRLDLLINNAGVVITGPVGTYSRENWDRIMAVNARAPFFLIQGSLDLLSRADPGFIINIGSVVSRRGYAGQALYSASKHALLGLTKAVARDLADTSVRVHAVLPGGVNTEMVRSARPDIDTSELISPEEVARTVRFLLEMEGNAVIDEISLRRKTKTPWE